MYIIYSDVIALVSDEPALYLYGLKSGILKDKYDLTQCKLKVKGKTKFKLLKKGEGQFSRVSNKFKLRKIKKGD